MTVWAGTRTCSAQNFPVAWVLPIASWPWAMPLLNEQLSADLFLCHLSSLRHCTESLSQEPGLQWPQQLSTAAPTFYGMTWAEWKLQRKFTRETIPLNHELHKRSPYFQNSFSWVCGAPEYNLSPRLGQCFLSKALGRCNWSCLWLCPAGIRIATQIYLHK